MGYVKACWCPRGIRPIVPKQQVRQQVDAYAAVAPQLGLMTCLILPYANTQMMNLFWAQVSREFVDYFVILQLDKAAWHRSNCLTVPENIRLIFQPASSPELMRDVCGKMHLSAKLACLLNISGRTFEQIIFIIRHFHQLHKQKMFCVKAYLKFLLIVSACVQ